MFADLTRQGTHPHTAAPKAGTRPAPARRGPGRGHHWPAGLRRQPSRPRSRAKSRSRSLKRIRARPLRAGSRRATSTRPRTRHAGLADHPDRPRRRAGRGRRHHRAGPGTGRPPGRPLASRLHPPRPARAWPTRRRPGPRAAGADQQHPGSRPDQRDQSPGEHSDPCLQRSSVRRAGKPPVAIGPQRSGVTRSASPVPSTWTQAPPKSSERNSTLKRRSRRALRVLARSGNRRDHDAALVIDPQVTGDAWGRPSPRAVITIA